MESGSTIGNYAVANCPMLKAVYLPTSLTTIEGNAFKGSTALTDVYYAGSQSQWNSITLRTSGNDPLLNANIHLNADIHSTCTHPNTVLSGAQEATCGEAGYTGDRICTVCGETVSKGRTIPALEHSWSDWVQFFPATENKNGYEVRVCGNCGKTETHVLPKLNPFTDVSADSPFHDAILWAYSHDPQITTGTSATEFSPGKACTRGQVVTFLWRAAGKPEPASTSNPFRDVSSSSSFYKAILWAAEQGITSGTSAGTFSPNETCTRGQVVTFLWRYEGRPEPSSLNNPFTDVSSGSSFFKAILWAAEQGITTGKTPTTFNPTGECTRAHVVTFLYRDMA